MKSRVYEIITAALEKANVTFDTDGENIWVDPPQGEEGRTVSLNVIECESAEDEDSQQQDEPMTEPEKDAKGDGEHRYIVSLHADMTKLFEVTAPDEATAEAIVNTRWMNDEITIDELSLAETKIDVSCQVG